MYLVLTRMPEFTCMPSESYPYYATQVFVVVLVLHILSAN